MNKHKLTQKQRMNIVIQLKTELQGALARIEWLMEDYQCRCKK